MKSKIIWLMVSCLMVASLLLASCASAAAPEAPAAPVAPVAPAAPTPPASSVTAPPAPVVELEKPRYGGTAKRCTIMSILGWDDAFQAPWTLAPNVSIVYEKLACGDWAKGPAGTGETDFLTASNVVYELERPWLAESWEFPDDSTLIFHIRDGVRWQNKPPMNGRELNAYDVAFSIKRIFIDLPSTTMYNFAIGSLPTEVYAKDDRTVVVKCPQGQAGMVWEYVTEWTYIEPKDVIEKYGDCNDWTRCIGTGAFMVSGYVPMAMATYVKNPDYWDTNPVGPGKGDKLPYLDEIRTIIITDAATRLSAMRTGKIEHIYSEIYWEDALSLMKTNPELKYKKGWMGTREHIGIRVDKVKPVQDIRVRRALNMAINRQEIVDTYWGGYAQLHCYKVFPFNVYVDSGAYTPLDQLPQDVRELWEYHPDKAKQLMIEAGYPNGFSFECWTRDIYVDRMAIIKEYWMKNLNVDMKMGVREYGVYTSARGRRSYDEAIYTTGWFDQPQLCKTIRTGMGYNWSYSSDPKFDEYYLQIAKNYFNKDERNRLLKECNIYAQSQSYLYNFPIGNMWYFWSPWIKNYHGEYALGQYNFHYWNYVWCDQELKKSMGY